MPLEIFLAWKSSYFKTLSNKPILTIGDVEMGKVVPVPATPTVQGALLLTSADRRTGTYRDRIYLLFL